MPSSSARGRTGSSRRTGSPTPAGACSCSRRSPSPAGAVRSAELTHPGFVHDLCSAFYPLGVASPVMRVARARVVRVALAVGPARARAPGRATAGARCCRPTIDETAASLDEFAAGDGDAWRELYGEFERISDALLDAMTSPIPPVRGAARLAAAPRTAAGCSTSRVSRCSRSASSRATVRRAKAARCCSPATRCTAT